MLSNTRTLRELAVNGLGVMNPPVKSPGTGGGPIFPFRVPLPWPTASRFPGDRVGVYSYSVFGTWDCVPAIKAARGPPGRDGVAWAWAVRVRWLVPKRALTWDDCSLCI